MKKDKLTIGALVALLLSSTVAVAESDYPATNFKPVIVFQDQDANESSKKNESTGVKKSNNVANVQSAKTEYATTESVSDEETVVASKPAVKEEKSNTNVLIGLGVLVAAGVFFFTRKSGVSTAATGSQRSAGGLTGVERYLNNLNLVGGTGVTRYLDKKATQLKEKAESTGVSKYLKEKAQAPRVVASTTASPRGTVGGATGVAKYLRDKA